MLDNYAYKSKLLPQAILQEPIRFIEYYKLKTPFINCPAIQDFYKNVFIIPFPVDFYCKFSIKENQILFVESNLHEESVSIFCVINEDTFDLQLRPLEIIYWSDKNCVAESWGTELPTLLNIAGSFNIKNWIRPVHSAYLIPKNSDELIIDISRGSPWLFLKFNYEEKVNLKYNYDKSVIEESYKMANFSGFLKGAKKFFKRFEQIRPRKLTK